MLRRNWVAQCRFGSGSIATDVARVKIHRCPLRSESNSPRSKRNLSHGQLCDMRTIHSGNPTWRRASPMGFQISGRPVWDLTNWAMLKAGSNSSTRRTSGRGFI